VRQSGVVGASLGATLALHTARRSPDGVRSLALRAPVAAGGPAGGSGAALPQAERVRWADGSHFVTATAPRLFADTVTEFARRH
jgi:pimeloyl-ACP methyl ester carboxylesterase